MGLYHLVSEVSNQMGLVGGCGPITHPGEDTRQAPQEGQESPSYPYPSSSTCYLCTLFEILSSRYTCVFRTYIKTRRLYQCRSISVQNTVY